MDALQLGQRPQRVGRHRIRLAGAIAAVAVALTPVTARADDDGSRWKWSAAATASGTYDSNVFNLDEDGEGRIDDPDDTDRDTNRVRDMESVQDFITSTGAEFEAETRTPLGKLTLGPRVTYHYYTQNPEKSFPEFGFEIRQKLPDSSALSIDVEYEMQMFKKNYLKDTSSSNQTIDRDERIYDTGRYDDTRVELSHERRLWKGEKDGFFRELEAEPFVAYTRREFGSGFSNRDLNVYTAGLELTPRLGERVELEVAYDYSFKEAPGNRELAIVDEDDVNRDLNDNGNRSDNNQAMQTRVDRSRDVHTLGAGFTVDLPHRLECGAGYSYTWTDYRSRNDLDLAHKGRKDGEHAVGAGLEWGFGKHWKVELSGEAAFVDSNTPSAVAADEEAEKTRYGFGLTFGWDF